MGFCPIYKVYLAALRIRTKRKTISHYPLRLYSKEEKRNVISKSSKVYPIYKVYADCRALSAHRRMARPACGRVWLCLDSVPRNSQVPCNGVLWSWIVGFSRLARIEGVQVGFTVQGLTTSLGLGGSVVAYLHSGSGGK